MLNALVPGGNAALLWLHWRSMLAQHPARMLLSIIMLAVGVALGLSVELVNRSALAEFDRSMTRLNGKPDLSVRASAGTLDETIYDALLADTTVIAASPVIESSAELRNPATGTRLSARLLGIDPLRAAQINPALVPTTTAAADLFSADALFLDTAAIRQLDAQIGDAIELRVGMRSHRMRLAGSLAQFGGIPTLAVVDLASLQWHFGWLGALSRIDLLLAPGSDAESMQRRHATLGPKLSWSRPDSGTQRMDNLSRAYRVNLNMLALVALLTGVFLVHANMALSTRRQWRTFALLQTLGASRRLIGVAVLGQGLMIGLLGSLLGCVVGLGTAAALLHVMGADFGAGIFGQIDARLHLSPMPFLVFCVLGTAAGLTGASVPARSAVNAQAAAGLRAQADEIGAPSRYPRALTPLLIVCGAAALLLPPVAELPIGSYAAMAFWLFAVVTRVGTLLGYGARALDRAQSRFARWPGAWLAIRRTSARPDESGVSMAGVVASFALAAAMAIMVHSFRGSVGQWLDTVLPGDVYTRIAENDARASIDDALIEQLGLTNGVEQIRLMRSLSIRFDENRPDVRLLARQIGAEPAYRNLPLTGPILPPENIADNCVALYGSEAMTDLYGWAVGKRVALPIGPPGACFTVAGLWRDYARQHGAIALDLADYRMLTGDLRITDMSIKLRDATGAGDLIAQVKATIPGAADLPWRSAEQIRALSIRIFDQSFVATYALEAVAILMGVFGVTSGYASQVLSRRREFGMLQHLGLTRIQIARMMAAEAAITVGIGVLIGLGLGTTLALILIKQVNPVSFHWSMDIDWPVGLLLASGLSLLGLACATAAGIAWHSTRQAPASAVRSDW